MSAALTVGGGGEGASHDLVIASLMALLTLAICGKHGWKVSPVGIKLKCLTNSSNLDSSGTALARRAMIELKACCNLPRGNEMPQDRP